MVHGTWNIVHSGTWCMVAVNLNIHSQSVRFIIWDWWCRWRWCRWRRCRWKIWGPCRRCPWKANKKYEPLSLCVHASSREEINWYLIHFHHWYFTNLIHCVFERSPILLCCNQGWSLRWTLGYLGTWMLFCIVYCVLWIVCVLFIVWVLCIVLQPWVELWDGHLDAWRRELLVNF